MKKRTFHRYLCGMVLALSLTGGGQVFAASSLENQTFSAAQKAEIEGIIRNYLLENPKLLQEVVDKLTTVLEGEQKAQQAEAIAQLEGKFVSEGITPVLGNPKGDVDVVIFFDYNCGYCRAALPILDSLIKADPGVRVVMREFPVLGDNSRQAALGALAAYQQGKYAAFHSAIAKMEGQTIGKDAVESVAKKIGLDMNAFREFMQSQKALDELSATYSMAQTLGIRGTPGYVIGEHVFPGMVELGVLQEFVSVARKKTGKTD